MYSTVEPAAVEELAEEARARLVFLTGRIDRRNPHEIGRELDDFVRRAIDFHEDAFDGLHEGWPSTISQS